MHKVGPRPLLKVCRLPAALCLQMTARVGEEREAALCVCRVRQQRTAASAQESSERNQQRGPTVVLRQDPSVLVYSATDLL